MAHGAPAGLRLAAAWCLAIGAWATASAASAQGHVIGPGQEETVLALFEPHRLGAEVAAGYALWSVAIESNRIEVTLEAGGERRTTLTLRHVDEAPVDAVRTTSFGIVRGTARDPGAVAAEQAIVSAIQANDRGQVWRAVSRTAEPPASSGVSIPRIGWRDGSWVPIDGLLVIALIWLLATLLAARLLIGQPRWMVAALSGIVVAGVGVRLLFAPAAFLGAWPWSRLYPHIRAVSEGSWLARLSEHAGQPFFLTDVSMWTNFAYASAMPLVLFAHAGYLLRDPRAGLAASFALAFLPQHIRFSRCEDGFVASLVLTSLAFALIHGWLRDPSRRVRWALLTVLPLILYPGYLLRPLNLLFVPVYLAAVVALHGETAPRWRRGVASAVVVLVGVAAGYQSLHQNGEAVQHAVSSLGWIGRTLHVLAAPRLLVLTDPSKTPPLLLLLAVTGGVLAWRAGERRLVLFLCGWLLLFVVFHAFVVQETMQPRYHLHLVVPFLLLAASSVARVPDRFRRWVPAMAIVLAASPILHHRFVTDLEYAEMREYDLVRRARDLVPEGCTVLELTTSPYEVDDLRFSRIGALAGRDRLHRFDAIGVFPGGRTGPGQRTLEELEASPPSCLYVYEGLACTAARAHGESYARDCVALRRRFRAETVLEARAPARAYDSGSLGRAPLSVSELPLRLSRARLGASEPPRGAEGADHRRR